MLRIATSKIFSRSFHFCVRNGQQFADLSKIVHKELDERFKFVSTAETGTILPVFVSDPIFDGLSLRKQREMVLNFLPKYLKSQIRLETIPPVSKVVLMENVLEETKMPATPQDYLNNAVFLLKGGNGPLASEAAWNCGSLQLSNFLLCHQLDAKHDELKERVVDFLKNSFTDQILWRRFHVAWKLLEEGYENYFEDDCTLDEVKEFLEYAEHFCNILYNIYMENSLSRDDFINGVSPYFMEELLIPIDGEWKTIEKWKKLGKIELEGTRPNIKLIFK